MRRAAGALVAGLAAAACGFGALAPRAAAQVDVYVAFMDEESAPPLEELLRKFPGKKILVVERLPDKVKAENRLFERPLSSFGQEQPVIMSTGGDLVDQPGSPVQKALANNIQAQMNSRETVSAIDAGYAGGKAKTVVNGKVVRDMAVIDMNPSVASEDVIVFVRSPEMGLQPSMVEPMLTPLLKGATALPQAAAARGGSHLLAYGAGGAIGSDVALGSTSKVGGSVYVGFEVEKAGGRKQYRAVVKLTDGERDTYFYKGDLFADPRAADKAAQAMYMAEGGKLRAPGGKSLAQSVSEMEASTGRTVGQTSSHFIGVDEKKVGTGIGLSNGNMEDSQVLTSARRAGFSTVDVERFNSDPAAMTPETTSRINSWARHKTYSAQDYEDALMWGLEGKNIDSAKASAFVDGKGGPFEGMSRRDIARQFYVVQKGPNQGRVLDGLYDEVASDLLTDATRGELLGHKNPKTGQWDYTGIFPRSARDRLSASQLRELDGVLEEKSGELARAAQGIVARARGEQPDWAEIRKEVRAFVEGVRSVDLGAHPDLAAAIESALPGSVRGGRLQVLGSRGAGDRFEVWLRDEKWDGQQSRTLRDMMAERGFNEAATDRLSFKGAMTPGLQETAVDRAVEKELLLRAEGRMIRDVGSFKALGIPLNEFEGFATGLLGICAGAAK